jgi:glycosyltransferase involved in cell wall biosynthesis
LNIAFLAPYTPTRIRTRSFHFLKTLAQQGHRLTLFSVWSDNAERDALAEIEGFDIRVIATKLTRQRSVWNSVRAAPTSIPLQAYYSWEPGLARVWLKALGDLDFDIVHVEHLRGAQYARAAHNAFGMLPLVWDSVDCISALFEQTREKSASLKNRLISRVESPRTRAYEAALIRLLPQTMVVSEAERRALLALPTTNRIDPAERVHVVPIGIDLEYFSRRAETREPATIVFSGKLSYHANVTAARILLDEIMPRVWARLPQARVLLVGANPPRAL